MREEKESSSVELSEEDKQNMRIFLKGLYYNNPAIVDSWQMNTAVFLIIEDIFILGVRCSDTTELIPLPTDLVGGKGFKATKEILKAIAKRVAKDRIQDKLGKPSINIMCKSSVAAAYRSAIEEAGIGI